MMQTPIRVLHVVGAMDHGGAETMIMNLYRAIDRDSVQFDFVTHSGSVGFYDEEIKSLGGKKYICPHYNGFNHVVYVKWWKNFFNGHAEYKILHSHIRSVASIYLPIAKKRGLTTIVHSHSTSNGNGFRAFVKNILQIPIRYQADYLFACSQEAGEWLFGREAIRTKRFKIIPNSIDVNKFRFNAIQRRQIRQQLIIEKDFVIGHVGRLGFPKNHIFLFRCFREFLKLRAHAKLLVIGNGDLSKQLHKEVKDLGIEHNVMFLGLKTNVQDYYQAMDCFVFPSLYEGLGMAILEAQASGLPCVVSDVVPRFVDVGAGLVKFKTLKASPSDWAKEIHNVKRVDTSEFMSKFDIRRNAVLMQRLYQEIAPPPDLILYISICIIQFVYLIIASTYFYFLIQYKKYHM